MAGKVAFTEDAAKRIAAATLAYERGNRDMPPIKFRPVGGDDGGGESRLSKTESEWAKGTSAELCIYEGQPLSEVATSVRFTAYNKMATIPEGKWVIVSSIGGSWYLVAAECEAPSVTTP